MNTNAEVRNYARKKHVLMWEIAQEMGIAEQTLYRYFRTPFKQERKQQITESIDAVAKRHEMEMEKV